MFGNAKCGSKSWCSYFLLQKKPTNARVVFSLRSPLKLHSFKIISSSSVWGHSEHFIFQIVTFTSPCFFCFFNNCTWGSAQGLGAWTFENRLVLLGGCGSCLVHGFAVWVALSVFPFWQSWPAKHLRSVLQHNNKK